MCVCTCAKHGWHSLKKLEMHGMQCDSHVKYAGTWTTFSYHCMRCSHHSCGHPRLFRDTAQYKLEPYWSRCQMGVRYDDGSGKGRHAWLGTNPDMHKNIEAANFVDTQHCFSFIWHLKFPLACNLWKNEHLATEDKYTPHVPHMSSALASGRVAVKEDFWGPPVSGAGCTCGANFFWTGAWKLPLSILSGKLHSSHVNLVILMNHTIVNFSCFVSGMGEAAMAKSSTMGIQRSKKDWTFVVNMNLVVFITGSWCNQTQAAALGNMWQKKVLQQCGGIISTTAYHKNAKPWTMIPTTVSIPFVAIMHSCRCPYPGHAFVIQEVGKVHPRNLHARWGWEKKVIPINGSSDS